MNSGFIKGLEPDEGYFHRIREDSLNREIAKLREALIGWEGYGWKDGVYIDNLDEYFQKVLRREER
jgi:hypothetical protein